MAGRLGQLGEPILKMGGFDSAVIHDRLPKKIGVVGYMPIQIVQTICQTHGVCYEGRGLT